MVYVISIEESINRILKTPLGSRVMRPKYGSLLYTLRDRKFDDEFRVLATKYIFEAIKENEKRVKVAKVDFNVNAVKGVVSFKIYLANGDEVVVNND
jgi:phage baseplate assembly protein W